MHPLRNEESIRLQSLPESRLKSNKRTFRNTLVASFFNLLKYNCLLISVCFCCSMAQRLVLLVAVQFSVLAMSLAISGNRWYNNRLLINPGLAESNNATSADDCINQCSSTTGCSAVSYQLYKCVLSMCSALHLVFNNGWNTYVIGKYKQYTE